MAGVLAGVRVLDLSWGIAGPMAAMMMADNGADVIKIEPPGGDPYRNQLGYRAWQRGKRSAILDLKSAEDKDDFLALVKTADVLVESYTPGVTDKLGIDYAALAKINPRLVYCSITGYGRGTKDEQRPAYDALVAARIGLHWEQRGWPEGALNHMSGLPDPFADAEIDPDWLQGANREGPLFPASYWPSLGAFFSASVGISAALRAREHTGRGQWVETSLLQGAMASAAGAWMRAEKVDTPGFDSWIIGCNAPKGHFQCADGDWIHNWVPNPRFILEASKSDELNATPELKSKDDPDRFGTGPEELLVMTHYHPILAEAVAKFPAKEWVDAAAKAGQTMQNVRSPEAALADPILLEDGSVVEVDDPELGSIRQVGITYKMSATPGKVGAPPVAPGAHTEEVRAEAQKAKDAPTPQAGSGEMKRPLEGVTVLDLGLAVAGPYGTQILSDLGATVIKVNGLYDMFWHQVHIAYMCNRGKQSITLNLKDPRSMDVLMRMIEKCDVVHHNMRYSAAERLKIDYESLKKINPSLIYCHSRGFEDGPRKEMPGNDQTGACLSGIQYEDGGMSQPEGKPLWSLTSMGDTGNGFLSAIAVIQALMHRDKTGEGQMVDTSILNAGLLNTSYAMAKPDGSGFERPRTDGMQLGYSAGHRLYPTKQGWLCVVCATQEHWDELLSVLHLENMLTKERFATDAERKSHDAEVAKLIGNKLKTHTAAEWFEQLDAAGVPVEVVSEDFSLGLHDNPEFQKRDWTVSYDHPHVGKLDQIGLCVNLSDTPGKPQQRPVIVGEHTKEILASMGFSEEEMDKMEEEMAIGYAGMPRMPTR